MQSINFNNESLFLRTLLNGRTIYTAKVGRDSFRLEVEKNALSAFVTIKGDCVKVHRNKMIDKDFIKDFSEIAKAQRLLEYYNI